MNASMFDHRGLNFRLYKWFSKRGGQRISLVIVDLHYELWVTLKRRFSETVGGDTKN